MSDPTDNDPATEGDSGTGGGDPGTTEREPDPGMGDPDAGAADLVALRAAVAKADSLIAHYHQGITLAQSLKRTLVLRMLHAQYPRLSIADQERLLKSYGVAP